MSTGSSSTPAIIEAFTQGEERAFDFFFRSYYAALCLFANSYLHNEEESRDLVQDCFIRLWENHAMMSRQNHIQSFLYTVVRNRCIDLIRRRKVQVARHEKYTYLADKWEGEELNEVKRVETIRLVFEAVERLPARIRQVFRMHYMEGKNYNQIAEELQVSPRTVRNQKLRALVLLKGKLVSMICMFIYFL